MAPGSALVRGTYRQVNPATKRVAAHGGLLRGAAAWSTHVITDGNLVTGQNQGSAEAAAEAVLKQLHVLA